MSSPSLIKRFFLKLGIGSYLDVWSVKSNVKGFDEFHVRRSYDKNPLFVDVYWHVRRRNDHSKVDTIYRRADNALLKQIIRRVEQKELPRLQKKHRAK